MKKFILFFIAIISLNTYSQFGNRRNQRNQRQGIPQTQSKPKPNFEAEKYLGIVVYDIKKAAKKSSIKLSSEEGKKFLKIITGYNKSIKDITRINSFTLKNTKNIVESYQKKAIENGDFSGQEKIYKIINANFKPISETLKNEDKKLISKLKLVLSKKQYKKWIKYNKKFKKVFPKEEL